MANIRKLWRSTMPDNTHTQRDSQSEFQDNLDHVRLIRKDGTTVSVSALLSTARQEAYERGRGDTQSRLLNIGTCNAEGLASINYGEVSDGYHTFNELYHYRMLYNAALFNEWAAQGLYDVHKSLRHSDGEYCFGGGWFVVVAELPTGQITNHYEDKYYDLFHFIERKQANKWDGHTPADVAKRLEEFLTSNNPPAMGDEGSER